MAGQLLLDIDYEISAQCETSNYLDTHRWGYYSLCSKPQAHSRDYRVPFQRSYPLDTLPSMLKLVSTDRDSDYWVTQAVFSRKNRRKVNLAHVGVAFVDLDYYKIRSLADYPPEAMAEKVLLRCQQYEIPLPSLIVDSGQGLQIKWFHDKLPAKALPRWEYLQTWLNQLLLDLGADMGAKDISRILRVVQTVNQKNRFPVRVLWVQDDGYTQEPYNFNDLIETVQQAHINHFRLTPTVPTRTRTKTQSKAPVTQFRLNSKQFSEDSLNWSRVCDLKKLVQLRGDMGDGMREPMAFYLCNHYALRYSRDLALNPMDEWHEFRNLCKTAAPSWMDKKIREKTSNLYQLTRDDAEGKTKLFMGKEYRPLYTPKNQYLIDLFGITADEQRKLITIIGEEEYQRREWIRKSTEEYKEEHRERNKTFQEAKRREAGAKPREEYLQEAEDKMQEAIRLHQQGMSQRKIAKAMGISVGAVNGYLKSRKSVQSPLRA